MSLRRGTWLAIAVTAIVLALLNLHPWKPGIGERTDRINGLQPVGSELELYFGWPACYRAELLRSDDPGMGAAILKTAPFFIPPYADGQTSSRHVSWLAIVLDASFALFGLVLMAVVVECHHKEQWNFRAVLATLIIALFLVAEYLGAEFVSVHL